jgi:hypothetical protein
MNPVFNNNLVSGEKTCGTLKPANNFGIYSQPSNKPDLFFPGTLSGCSCQDFLVQQAKADYGLLKT